MNQTEFNQFYFIDKAEENISKLLREIPEKRTKENSFYCDGITNSLLNEAEKLSFLVNKMFITDYYIINYIKPSIIYLYEINKKYIEKQRKTNKSFYSELVLFYEIYKDSD